MDSYPYRQQFLFAGAVALCGSVLYSAGFWGSFNFNALEFISISDLPSHTIFPLLIAFASPLLGIGLSNLTVGESLPPGGGANTPIGRFLRQRWRLFYFILIIVLLIIIKYGSFDIKITLLPLVVGMFGFPLSHLEIAIEFFPHPRVRSIATFLAIALPTYALSWGAVDANRCKYGPGKYQVDLTRTKFEFHADAKHPVIYLGYLSGNFIFYEQATSSIVIVKQKDDTPIYIRASLGRT